GASGTVVRLLPAKRSTPLAAGPAGQSGSLVERELALLVGRSPVFIAGEPGSGRTSAVRALAGAGDVVFLDAATVPSLGEQVWARRLDELASSHSGVLAVENVHLLTATLTARLSELVVSARPRMMLTSAPRDTLSDEVASLAAACVSGVDLPPLRSRREELHTIAYRMLDDLRADRSVRLRPSVLSALARNQWPGNLVELRMVLQQAAQSRTAGDITLADLPASHRDPAAARSFTPWEQAERDAIVAALRATEGNKVQAADRLGISRNTLYRRIRTLQIGS
ncbi:MAG: helix-turn-helix domain-containing protein, partial [Thermocrispum sp.]